MTFIRKESDKLSQWEHVLQNEPCCKKICLHGLPSRKHLCTKVTPDFHLTYSENRGNLGSGSK